MGYEIDISKKTYWLLTIQVFYVQIISGIFDNFRSIAMSSMRSEFNLDYDVISYIITALGYCYVAFGFFVTWCIQKFSYKCCLLTGLMFWFVGAICIFFSYSFPTVMISLIIVWFGTAFIQICNNALATAIFLKNTTLMISLAHFVFGIGTILSPLISRNIIPLFDFGFRSAYMITLPFTLIAIIYILCTKYDFKRKVMNNEVLKPLIPMSQLLKKKVLWLIIVTYSFMAASMYVLVDWFLIYLQDMYNWDPTTEGTKYMTVYTITYTVSRVLLAIVNNKMDTFTLYYIALITSLVLFIAGFCFGENGSYAIAATGISIGAYWPLIVCINMKYWEENAPIASSLMTSLTGIFKEILNLIVGYVNKFVGKEWGFKLLVPYTLCGLIGIICIHIAYNYKRKENESNKKYSIDVELSTKCINEKENKENKEENPDNKEYKENKVENSDDNNNNNNNNNKDQASAVKLQATKDSQINIPS
ncbi:hypothetical protein WA158_000569 [Blastocystis sp. Blastoise]